MPNHPRSLPILLAVIAVFSTRCGKSPDRTPAPTPAPAPAPAPDAHANLIRVNTPHAHAAITSPLVVTGQARGIWYFEASFPVKLLDGNGAVLAQAPAQAQGEWMTTEFVPFRATLTFTRPTTATGTLMLQKDNASGLPKHDDSISIPVNFSGRVAKGRGM